MTCRYMILWLYTLVIAADNLNACLHLLYFCSSSHVHSDSMLRENKDGLRKAILRNGVLLGCPLQDSLIVCSC